MTNLEYLRQRCLERIPYRYERSCFPSAAGRLDHELAVVDRLGRVDEFLAVAELAEFAREEGMPFRLKGSGCSSIITYLVRLSDVDPIEHRLYFERFRNPQGHCTPAFLIQVDQDHQERIHHVANLGCGRSFVDETLAFMPAGPLERATWLVVESLWQKRRFELALRRIPRNDVRVFQLIQSGDIEGFPWLGADDFRYLLPRFRPASIEHLAAAITLYTQSAVRPDLMERLDRPGDLECLGSEIPAMPLGLGRTRGLILYQEQIMMLLERIGGIWPADGYQFIKAAAKRKAAAVAGYRAKFLRTAVENGIDPGTAARLFGRIVEAAGYASCKASRLAEAMMIYQAAYLKAHYRVEFDQVLKRVREQDKENRDDQETSG